MMPPVVGPSDGASMLTLSAARKRNLTPFAEKSRPLFAISTSISPIASDSGVWHTTFENVMYSTCVKEPMAACVAKRQDESASFSNPDPISVTLVPPICGPADGCKTETDWAC